MRAFNRAMIAICATGLVSTAWASGGNSMPRPSTEDRTPPAEEQALEHYNFGVAARERAQKLEEKAAAAANEKERMKLTGKAQKNFASAVADFRQATGLKPDFYQAYSDLGYCLRKTHEYGDALDAYDRALQLEPGYTPAIEYRGEAYLGLNRVDDAKQAYLQLFSVDRPEADALLAAMKAWVEQRRQQPDGVDAGTVDSFAGWIGEREEIAGQTASLSSNGPRDW